MDLARDIKAFFGRRNVSEMETGVSDYFVKIPGADMQFALKLLENGEEGLKKYKAQIVPIFQLRGMPKLPLVVAFQDEKKEISLGVVIKRQFGTAVIEESSVYIPLSEENRAKIYDEIKSADDTIRMLESVNCKVIKHLDVEQKFNGISYFAEIVYLRDLSLSYRMKSRDDLSDIERFNYYLKEIPKEDYPFDDLDKGIRQSLMQSEYEIVNERSQLLLFSSELRDFRLYYSNKESVKLEFLVLPDFSSAPIMVGKTLKPLYLDMYIESKNEFTFQKQHFTIDIPLNNVNDYYNFIDGTKTLCTPSGFLSIK